MERREIDTSSAPSNLHFPPFVHYQFNSKAWCFCLQSWGQKANVMQLEEVAGGLFGTHQTQRSTWATFLQGGQPPPQSFSALRAGVALPALNTSSWLACSCRSDKDSPSLLENDLILAGNKLGLYFLTTVKYFSSSVLTLQQDFILRISSP